MNELIFNQPYLLLLLFAIPLLIVFYFGYLAKSGTYLIISQLSSNFKQKDSSVSPKTILFLIRICSLACLIIAMAGPVMVTSIKKITSKQDVSFVLALDVSGSMLIEDLKPNRIEALKEAITNFITFRRHDRIGLILYAGESHTYAPLTKDTRFLLNKIQTMEDVELEDGTAIGLGLASAINTLKESRSKDKVIILLTDGEHNSGFVHPLTAAAIASKNNIKVHTIALGTKGKVPMPIVEIDGSKRYIFLESKLDEVLLKQMASQTGGRYFNAANKTALKEIYKTIDSLEKTQKFIEFKKEFSSRSHYFILAAIILLIIETGLGFTFLKTFTT
jgi:Ca-activated chloride channel family protein